MILDTGCPKNVAGKVWVDCFIDSLNIDLAEKVKTISVKGHLNFEVDIYLRHYTTLKFRFF